MPDGQLEHRLVSVTMMTDEEYEKWLGSMKYPERWDTEKSLKTPLYRPPAPIKVPPPPDYSTPKKVSARCRERGTPGAFNGIGGDPKFKNLYKEFRQLVPPIKVRLADLHRSKYRIVDKGAYGRPELTLEEIPAKQRKPAKRRRA
jgi:hypothetical protein